MMSRFHLIWGLVRIALGWTFLWAFLDKLLGLGFATASERAWLAGGSPTSGFLTNATQGPLAGFYQGLAGQVWVDWLFMAGLLLIGLSLLLGILVRMAVISGVVMMLLMYTAAMPPANNPVTDDHIIYALVLLLMLFIPAGHWLGLGHKWEATSLVKGKPWLK